MFIQFHRRHLALAALLFLALVTLLPSLGVRYTIWDNLISDLHVLRGESAGDVISFYREVIGGRPQVWLLHPIDWLLASSRSPLIHQGAKLLLGLGSGLFLALALARFTRSRMIGLLAGTLYWATLQNLPHFDFFNPTSLALQLALIAYLASIALASAGRGYRVWLAAGLLLFSAILYEAYALLGVLTVVASVWGRLQKLSEQNASPASSAQKPSIKSYLVLVLPFLIVAAVFLFLYQLSNLGLKGDYEGSGLGEVMSGLPWKVYRQYTFSGFPLYHFFHHDLPMNRQILFASGVQLSANPFSLADVISQLRAGWLARAVLVGGLFLWASLRLRVSRRIIVPGLVFGLLMTFVPNLMVSVAEVHQNIFQWHAFTGHLTTCLSHMGWCVLLAVLAVCLIRIVRKFNLPGIVRPVVCMFLALGCGVASVMTDYWNQHPHGMEQQFGKKWDDLDVVLRSPAFGEIPDGARVLAPGLFEARSLHEGLLYDWDKIDYWTEYIRAVGGREVTVVRDVVGLGTALADGDPCYYLGYNEEALVGQSIVLGEIDPAHGGAAPRSQQAWIWDFSGRPDFQVVGRGSAVEADEGWWLFEDGSWFCARFPSSTEGRSLLGAQLDLGSLRTRGGEATPLVTPAGLGILEYGEGWVPWYEALPPEVRWLEGKTGEMTVYNRSASPIEVEASMQFTAASGSGNLRLYPEGLNEIHVILMPDGSSSGGVFRWQLKPGPNRLRLKAEVEVGRAYDRDVTVGLKVVQFRTQSN